MPPNHSVVEPGVHGWPPEKPKLADAVSWAEHSQWPHSLASQSRARDKVYSNGAA
jgi:hypothetical protein